MAFNANNEWMPEDDSVATRVSQITSADSPLMRQATAAGERAAARRGLMNSSIAAGSARAATIGAAVPIASQDAQQSASKNLARIQGDYSMSATKLDLDQKERASAIDATNQAFSTYGGLLSNIASNSKMKADARSRMNASALAQLNSQLSMLKQLYPNIQMDWGA